MNAPSKIRQHSDWYTTIASCVLFPIHEHLKKHTTNQALRSLEKTQWLNAEQLQSLQLQRLQKLLIHANQNVP